MASKWRLLLCCIGTLLPQLSWSEPPIESATVADLSALQQQILHLKVSIERLKLQQELQQLTPLAEASQDFCQSSPASIGSLTLTALYSVAGQRFASLAYNPHVSIEASRGEQLLCGESVVTITQNSVEIEKAGRRYQLTGAALPVPRATRRLPPAHATR
ncbi:hypothetical protein [unidentified bacterial endosymbiont]|uniref:hypothetical protein n=1 Tax=unidentified bacterial endosymbiont TaxID=2355 RepID=UPI00209E29C2|nr:hypothetical protein [unidentified bacterial endosymbiont]